MIKSLKAELYKLFKNRTFKVIVTIVIAMSILTVVMASSVIEKILMDSLGDMPENQKEIFIQEMMNSVESESIVTPGALGIQIQAKDIMNPTALEIYHSSFGSGFMEILIGILVASLMAKEYSQGTIKNFLAYGKKREEFYISKFLAMVIAITILLALLTIIPTIGTTIINGWGQNFELSQLLGMMKVFIAAILTNLAVASLIMIIATLVKSNGATIGIAVALFIGVPTLGGFLYGIYPWFDKIYEVLPFYNSALAVSIYSSNTDVLRAMIIASITIVIALIFGIKIFKTQDIK